AARAVDIELIDHVIVGRASEIPSGAAILASAPPACCRSLARQSVASLAADRRVYGATCSTVANESRISR
ncbi:MAG: hypothetical protein NTX09_20730, partial [Verrucomicrobia bacterium]|nr:hypothetical protein [Verrucomicrobiota bacterium]